LTLAKAYLLLSQITVSVTSAHLTCLQFRKEHKQFLCDPIRKIVDDLVGDKEFVETDRPYKRKKELEKKRKEERRWTEFKEKFEERKRREFKYR